MGEQDKLLVAEETGPVVVDTFGGRVHVEWDPCAAVTPLGQWAFFIEFLKTGGLFDPWVNDCPLQYKSPNAPRKRDVLGTVLLSALAGHHRYAHISAVRADNVNPELLGMNKVVSEEAVRRAFKQMNESRGVEWLKGHLGRCYEALLGLPWILDGDTTVKPLYGKQEGAVLGYNPQKPGRPSHSDHSYQMANTRLVLDVEVQAGNKTASCFSAPGLWQLLDRIPRRNWPSFFRGDSSWGTEAFMSQAEARGLAYLCKLRLTKNVRRLIEKAFLSTDWVDAGQGWEGVQDHLKLLGWSVPRRVIVLRRVLTGDAAIRQNDEQSYLDFVETQAPATRFEYAVLVTSLSGEMFTLAQHYRDRADAENSFDELKNQWGWGGYTTQDLKRCRLMARIVALINNWWSLFVRLARPDKHLEAITNCPLLLYAVAKPTRHQGQSSVTITSTRAKTGKIQKVLRELTTFLRTLKTTAEQLLPSDRWRMILSRAFRQLLKGKPLYSPLLISP